MSASDLLSLNERRIGSSSQQQIGQTSSSFGSGGSGGTYNSTGIDNNTYGNANTGSIMGSGGNQDDEFSNEGLPFGSGIDPISGGGGIGLDGDVSTENPVNMQ